MATDKQIQAALREFKAHKVTRYCVNAHPSMSDDIAEAMRLALEAAERAAWVSVKDGLPDRNCCVLVYEGRDGPFHAEYRTKTKKFHSMYVSEFDSFVYDHATHWMYEPRMEGE